MRELVSFCTIKEIFPMKDKDRIVCVSMKENAYEVIMNKEGLEVGKKIIFIQEGAILPLEEKWSFLFTRCYNNKLNKLVIKPMTMGQKLSGEKVKSWGIGVKIEDVLSDKEYKKLSKSKAGSLTKFLKIEKYEDIEDASPVDSKMDNLIKFLLSKKYLRCFGYLIKKYFYNTRGGFPSYWISKSEEIHIQDMKDIILEHLNDDVYVTQKLEGQSFTAMLDIDNKKHNLMVCSRNQAFRKKVNNDFWIAAEKYDIEKKLKKILKEEKVFVIIQGEQCGPKIQQNIYKFDSVRWFVYTIKIYNPKDKSLRQVGWDELESISKKLGLNTVPFVGKFKLSDIGNTLNDIVRFAEEQYWKTTKNGHVIFCYKPYKNEKCWEDYAQAEGIVIRTLDYDKSLNIGMSTKVKNINYSLKGLEKISNIDWRYY